MHEDPTFDAFMENWEEEYKTTGSRFEEKMTTLIKRFADSENDQRRKTGNTELIHVMPYSEAEDRTSGTDIMFRDDSGFFGHNGTIRIDTTHNFTKKNNMPFVKSDIDEPLIIKGLYEHNYEFKYGIRTGNPHINFEEPVIVIGFDMTGKEYAQFENDMEAQQNLAANIYEIVNMSNDMLQSFYYQADENTRKSVDAEFEPDERPDIELITFNEEYLLEVRKYASRRWKLPADTKLAEMSRELLQDLVYSPALERLSQKYDEQNLTESIEQISGSDELQKGV